MTGTPFLLLPCSYLYHLSSPRRHRVYSTYCRISVENAMVLLQFHSLQRGKGEIQDGFVFQMYLKEELFFRSREIFFFYLKNIEDGKTNKNSKEQIK